MLGDLVWDVHGKVTSMKRMPNGKVEETATVQGKFLGEEYSGTWTGEVEFRQDRTVSVQFQGVYTTQSDIEVSYRGIANGESRPGGVMRYRGAVCYSSPPGKFARLNGILVVSDVQVDDAGGISGEAWEWK